MSVPLPPEPAGPDRPAAPGVRKPADPERGLRGVMSGTLIMEAIVILLAIPVARTTGVKASGLGVAAICLLAVISVALCAFVSRPWFLPAALGLQVVMIVGWAITPTLGVMGIVFGVVWGVILWFRSEYRRRVAAGTLPVPRGPAPGP